MDVHQLRREQKIYAAGHLAALYQVCARRYMDAANLLEVGGPVIEEIRQSLYQAIELARLLPAFQSACERYNNEIYSPQADLWGSEQNNAFMLWSRYFHSIFIPAFVYDKCQNRNFAVFQRHSIPINTKYFSDLRYSGMGGNIRLFFFGYLAGQLGM